MVHYFSMSSVHSENLAEQVAQLDHFFNEYNSEAMQSSGSKSSLEMLKLSCDQLQTKYPGVTPATSTDNKHVGTICSTYDKMSETQALDLLKKRILKDTTHCHLWMFLFDILMKESKSHVAVWEDQKGMFRIKAPAKLAEMWGEKRNRTNMTYEKLSRSLRHYYEKKILRKVPKRKYTYKFNSKEILKSYEVQPFYRRNSTGQSQRQSKITPPSSGQSSPYAPITPSPSYMDSNKHFQWPQPPQYTQQSAWPTKQEATAVSDNQQMMANAYQQPQPQQMVTPQQDNSMLWSNQNQEQFTYGQVPQPSVQHQMSQTPTLPTDITNSMYVESSVYSTGMLLEAPTYTCAYTGGPNRKPAVQHRIAQPDGVINNLKMQPAAPLTLHIPPMCDQMSRQKSYTDYSLASSYCRSDSYSSHTSCDNNTSLDSFLESDKIFNDIMESLAMEVF